MSEVVRPLRQALLQTSRRHWRNVSSHRQCGAQISKWTHGVLRACIMRAKGRRDVVLSGPKPFHIPSTRNSLPIPPQLSTFGILGLRVLPFQVRPARHSPTSTHLHLATDAIPGLGG